MNRWLRIGLSIGIAVALHGEPLSEALNQLKENIYGFTLVDVGVAEENLALFRDIDIQRDKMYHHFGNLEMFQEELADFFAEVGANRPEVALQAAAQLTKIAHEIINGSGKESAWVLLRSFIPTNKYDLPRWHTDRAYYMPERPDELLFKFSLTLKGPSTLFYLLPPKLRKIAEAHIRNRHYMKNFCLAENIVTPRVGEGAVFMPNRSSGAAALHSEPPIHENRLYFCIVPCMKRQLPDLKARVVSIYHSQGS